MYRIVEKQYNNEDFGMYLSYGVFCDMGGVTIEDISVNKGNVYELIDKINQLNLSPIHLKDVVEDFIS